MPFMTFQVSAEQALVNAGRLIQEGHAHAVKLEGGVAMAPTVERLVSVGIPVMGHIGFTPQSTNQLSGYRVQGRGEEARERLVADAKALEAAGAFAIVIELTPPEAARAVSRAVSCPTIGIGAGPHVDGQVLVFHDMLGLSFGPAPKFVKAYANARATMTQAIEAYCREVRERAYPAPEHCYEDA
jgi:3-methyl-2-oxobutanoate hydroxymethyltransferase